MRKIVCCTFAIIVVLVLTACSKTMDIVGTWEQEMEMTVLGKEETSLVDSVCVFIFREDHTGVQKHILTDGSHPDAVREFSYHLDGDVLILNYDENSMEEFTVSVTGTFLQLQNRRGVYDLKKTK